MTAVEDIPEAERTQIFTKTSGLRPQRIPGPMDFFCFVEMFWIFGISRNFGIFVFFVLFAFIFFVWIFLGFL